MTDPHAQTPAETAAADTRAEALAKLHQAPAAQYTQPAKGAAPAAATPAASKAKAYADLKARMAPGVRTRAKKS